MIVTRNYRYLLRPTKSQRTRINKTLEMCRLVYNKLLETKINVYKETKANLSEFDLNKKIKELEILGINEVHSQVLQNINTRISLAFSGFFRRVKSGQIPGYPRFKAFERYDSYCYPQSGWKMIDLGKIRISKLGDIKFKEHRKLEGDIKTLTIKREGLKFYIIFCTEIEKSIIPRVVKNSVGLDLGVKNFLVLTDGLVIDNPKLLNKSLTKLKENQSKYSKTKSKRTKKTLNSLHTKVKEQRKDFLHKLSKTLISKYDQIFIEDLKIQKMLEKNPTWTGLHRNILDCGWANFSNMLEYKAEEAGVLVKKINPKNTSQRCSNCGELVPKTLNIRIHDCQNCGLVLDRDLNASRNILRIGLDSLRPRSLDAPAFMPGSSH